jgi:hypothetical protein
VDNNERKTTIAVQLSIPYDTLRELVKQLPTDEREQLLTDLLRETAATRSLTKQEKLALLNAMKLHNKVLEAPSVRREDWYGDDGC